MWAKKLGIFFLIFPRSGESIKDKRMRLYDKNMIEMRDGRKPVISPQLKSVSNYIDVSLDDIREACEAAFKNHSKKNDVVNFNSDFDGNSLKLYEWYLDGTYVSKIKYRKLVKENKNGKVREINSPDLTTRIYQHLVLVKLGPLYYEKDNMNGLNCKPGFGITASSKSRSLIKKMKHVYYDRLDLKYCLVIDQRKCYNHVKDKVFRKVLKNFISNKKFIDFVIDVSFVSGELPIGTPTSPFIHHLLMKDFDDLAKRIAPFSLRYADDNFLAFYTKEDANTAKDAKKCITNESWSSYFGLLKHCDSYSLMSKIENIMKLRDLTSTIRIDKKMDADNIDVKNLEGIVFDIVNYEIRSNNKNEPNWIKCLIGIPETNKEGIPTGRKLAREFHGNYQGIVNFISKCELTYGKDAILPITDVEIENRCGYVFKGSTNRLEYID